MGKYGKPYLPQNLGISFNISHSGKWVVCALSNDEVGIDIEKISFDLDIDVSKYFHKNESKIINSFLGKPKYYSFYRFWTAKESYLKCTGRGLSQPLNSFYVHNGFIYDKHNRKTQYQIDYYHVAKEYQAALCHIKNTTVARENISLVKICDLFATTVIR